jgi:hypothetical protein
MPRMEQNITHRHLRAVKSHLRAEKPLAILRGGEERERERENMDDT